MSICEHFKFYKDTLDLRYPIFGYLIVFVPPK